MSAVANRRVAGASSDKGQKIMLAVLCVVLVLLLVWQLPKLLGGSNSSTDGSTPVAVSASAPVAVDASVGGVEQAMQTPSKAAAARERKTARLIKRLPARDPFVPLAGAVPAAAPVVTSVPVPVPPPAKPTATPVPKVVPTAATIWIDGRRQVVGLRQTFKLGDTTFRLVTVTKSTATIVPVAGALDGASQVKLKRTVPVTIENTATGVQYVLRFSQAMSTVPNSDGKGDAR